MSTKRYKTFKYTVDLKDKSFEADFVGDWSRGDLDRMHKTAMRQLPKHKVELRRKENERRTNKK